jgi:hypothetical protein
MNPLTIKEKNIKLLLASIEHWKRMHDDIETCLQKGEIPDGKNCPLCNEYGYINNKDCKGCPIYEKAGSCRNTPYEGAIEAFKRYQGAPKWTPIKEWKEAASREIQFLQDMIQREEAKE